MSRLRLLDLFCGAGGAAVGYYRAGFDVVGVDIKPQPHYPFTFVQGDALCPPFDLRSFDAIHASPPCQAYSRLRHLPWLKDRQYPALLDVTREALRASGRPWVIENVEDAPMPYSSVLCGAMFGLPLYRHRRFGLSWLVMQPEHLAHHTVLAHGPATMATKYRGGGVTGVWPGHDPETAMGIDWMSTAELTQAIPPAYTEWIGRQLMPLIREQQDDAMYRWWQGRVA